LQPQLLSQAEAQPDEQPQLFWQQCFLQQKRFSKPPQPWWQLFLQQLPQDEAQPHEGAVLQPQLASQAGAALQPHDGAALQPQLASQAEAQPEEQPQLLWQCLWQLKRPPQPPNRLQCFLQQPDEQLLQLEAHPQEGAVLQPQLASALQPHDGAALQPHEASQAAAALQPHDGALSQPHDGSQPLSQPQDGAQELQQLPQPWLFRPNMRSKSSKPKLWLHKPTLTTSAPKNMFHLIEQRLLFD